MILQLIGLGATIAVLGLLSLFSGILVAVSLSVDPDDVSETLPGFLLRLWLLAMIRGGGLAVAFGVFLILVATAGAAFG